MGIATTVLGTMKFFRRKDKRKNDAASAPGGMPGFGSSSIAKHSAPAYGGGAGGGGYGLGDSRPDGGHRHQPFGSPPSGPYDPRAYSQSAHHFQPRPTRASAAVLAHLPAAILDRIFTFVCPHSRDESYATCEQSAVEDGCMLCDLRDLARCVAVCRRWKEEAVKVLYVDSRAFPLSWPPFLVGPGAGRQVAIR